MAAPAWVPSVEDLLEARVPSIRFGYRFEVLDQSLALLRQAHPEFDSAFRIENNVNRDTKRTLSGIVLTGDDAALFDPWSERLQVIVEYPQRPGLEYPLGVFLPATADENLSTAADTTAVDYHDQTLILRQGRRTTYNIAAGGLLTAALAALAAEVNLTVTSIDASTKTALVPMTWPPGTTRFDIMATICTALGYYSPYFTNAGVLRCKAVPDLTAATPDDIYYLDERSRILKNSITKPTQSFDTPNTYLVTSSGPNNSAVFGSYSVPSTAPHSVANRGYEVVETVAVQGLASNADCTTAAQALASQQTTYDSVSFVGWPDPRHDTFDVVEFDSLMYREQSWVWTQGSGSSPTTMGHEIRKVYA